MKKLYFILGVVGCLAVVMAFMNPAEEEHKNAVKEKLHISLLNSISEKSNKNEFSKILGESLGNLFGNKLVDTAVDKMISRKNYVVFSLTQCRYNDEDNTIGVGLLNHVFVTGKLETAFQDFLK